TPAPRRRRATVDGRGRAAAGSIADARRAPNNARERAPPRPGPAGWASLSPRSPRSSVPSVGFHARRHGIGLSGPVGPRPGSTGVGSPRRSPIAPQETSLMTLPDSQHPAPLIGKVALVTGAGSRGDGIGNGRATAVVLARRGATVVM